MQATIQMTAPRVPTPDDYREFLAGEARKGNLLAYVLFCNPDFPIAPLHRDMCEKLKASAIDGTIPRLIITCPPGHAKSYFTSEAMLALYLGMYPDRKVAVACYSPELAEKASRAVQERFASSAHQALFPNAQIQQGQSSVAQWATTRGGGLKAVGVGTAFTGFRCQLLAIDDPHKSRLEADSKSYRDRVWSWYVSVARQRLTPGGSIVMILTRWHRDDLAGRCLDPELAKRLRQISVNSGWKIVNYPAISYGEGDPLNRPAGAPLWPEGGYTVEDLMSRKAEMSDNYEWNALFQGNPSDREATAALLGKIKYVRPSQVPTIEQPRCWDLAVGEKEQNDFSVGARGGAFREKIKSDDPNVTERYVWHFYVSHIQRHKKRWMENKQTIYALGDKDGGRIRLEAVSAFDALADEVKAARAGKNLVSSFVPRGDKLTRATPWLALIDAGRFYIVLNEDGSAPNWCQIFLDELETFPGGKHDDICDSLSGLFQMVTKRTGIFLA